MFLLGVCLRPPPGGTQQQITPLGGGGWGTGVVWKFPEETLRFEVWGPGGRRFAFEGKGILAIWNLLAMAACVSGAQL